MNDPNSLTLRDKFAIEILQAILPAIISEKDYFIADPDVISFLEPREKSEEKIDLAIKYAYFVADKMRRYRLAAFE